jgi:hypothetical protein
MAFKLTPIVLVDDRRADDRIGCLLTERFIGNSSREGDRPRYTADAVWKCRHRSGSHRGPALSVDLLSSAFAIDKHTLRQGELSGTGSASVARQVLLRMHV